MAGFEGSRAGIESKAGHDLGGMGAWLAKRQHNCMGIVVYQPIA